jgi:predicted RNase H-like HicB family nuclease
MKLVQYAAIIERGGDGFGVYFPDLCGCTSGGDTLEHAITNAGEALALHTEGMIEDGQALPVPTPLDKITIEPDVDMHALILIEAHQAPRKVRINVMMDATLLTAIDAVASNRSLFLNNAARRALLER